MAYSITAQEFVVKRVSGEAKYLRGMSEEWETIKEGLVLLPEDLILTNENSFVQLRKGSEVFVLKGDAAIGLNHVREVSLNDLILALTLDEIRNVPVQDGNDISSNTAVYGTESQINEKQLLNEKILGKKKINGAKQLNENGYLESSIIAAKEVFRNYPTIAKNIKDRLYFADLLVELKLYREALEDYQTISELDVSTEENEDLSAIIEDLSLKILENN